MNYEKEVLKKASELLGNSNTQYVDQYDPSLLITFRRDYSLLSSGVDLDNKWIGYDIWNMWEVSFLLDNGVPIHGVGKLVIDSESEYIIESKSMKLYFFSFSMTKMGKDIKSAIAKLESTVAADISKAVKMPVQFKFFINQSLDFNPILITINKYDITKRIDIEKIKITDFKENPDLLEIQKRNDTDNEFDIFSIKQVKSNCKVTHQADFANALIIIDSKYKVIPESLFKYIVSFRQEYHFHEEACHMVYDRLCKAILPFDKNARIFVAFFYTRRGGIDINPIRTNSDLLKMQFVQDLYNVEIPWQKTMQQ